jgi:hypothetical protein
MERVLNDDRNRPPLRFTAEQQCGGKRPGARRNVQPYSSKSPDGWSLGVAKKDGEWNDAKPARQYLGSVQMKGSDFDNPIGHNLVISTRGWAKGCPGPSLDRNALDGMGTCLPTVCHGGWKEPPEASLQNSMPGEEPSIRRRY